MTGEPFRGVGPALVTPMKPDGSVDLDAFAGHVERVVAAGVHFVVPCGTTGESATLSNREQARVIRRCVEVTDGRVPVMAGAGTNSTDDAVRRARAAADAGATGILSVSPYYNRPSPRGLMEHYTAVAAAVELPVFIYNVPGRTASNVEPAVILELAETVDNIAGVKEASGRLGQVMTLLKERPDGFRVLSGEDDLTLPMMALGADGVISVVANEAPGAMARMCEAALAGDLEAARAVHWRLLELMRTNFVETNPMPVKTAMEILGHFDAHFRLPLTPLGRPARERLVAALEDAGLLEPGSGPESVHTEREDERRPEGDA